MVTELHPDAPERHVSVPATALSQRFGKPLFAHSIMLGVLAIVAGFDRETVLAALLETLPRFHEENREAFGIGCELGAQVGAGAA